MSDDIVGFLKNHTLLHGVPDAELANAASTMRADRFLKGERLMHEGVDGNDCYFIVQGTVQVHTRSLTGVQVVLAELGRGALIGEIALILSEKRTADVTAMNEVTALRLDRAAFDLLAEASPLFHESLTYAAELRMKHGLLRKASIWSAIPDSELRGLAEVTVKRKVPQGEAVVREGAAADMFYMVGSGRFEARSDGQRLAVLEAGDYFGEIALLSGQPQTATVAALEDSELLSMGSTEFQAILRHYAPVRRQFAEVVRIRRPDLPIAPSFGMTDEEVGLAEASARAPSAAKPQAARVRSTKWIDLLLALGGMFAVSTALAAWLQNEVWLLASLLAGGLVGPVTFVAYVRSTQLLGFSPVRLAAVFVSSAAVAVPLAWVLQRKWLFGINGADAGFTELAVPLTVALIEESAKLIVCAVLLRTGRMRFLMDAVVFGAAAGMGFAAIESMIYGWSYMERGSTGEMLAVLWVRALLSPLGHGTWTAIAAAGIWHGLNRRSTTHGKQVRPRNRGWLTASSLLLAAVALHTVWNYHFVGGVWRLLSMIAVGAAGLLLLYALIRQGTKDEDRALTALNPLMEAASAAGGDQDAAAQPLVCGVCKTQSPPEARYCARCGQALRKS